MNNQDNPQNQNNNSALGQVFKHSGKIAILLTIVVILGGIGAIALMEDASMEQKTIIKLSPDGFILENWIKKGEVERSPSKP